MCNQRRSNDTEIEINNEDIYIGGKFCSCYGIGSRTKDRSYDDHPYDYDDHLDDKCRKGSFEKGKFCHSPELEMPGVNQRPEDQG